MKKDQKAMDRLYAIIDDAAAGRYHEIFQTLGETQSKNGNFHCWNATGHSDGEDSNASLSVDNNTGKFLCHGCSKKGNLATYYKEFIANSPTDKWDGSFTKMMTDLLGLKAYLPGESGEDAELLQQAADVVRAFSNKPIERTKPADQQKKPVAYFPPEQNDIFVNTLMGMDDAKGYMLQSRFIKEDTITKYRIGFDKDKKCFTFPMFDANGNIVNVKMYRPWDLDYKWQAMIKGNPLIPAPVIHLTHSKLYIFEGEPDCYCAAAHGLYGITSGGVSQYSYKKIYGEQFENIFRNKEIVLVMDADDKGVAAASKIAEELYGIVKQIKVLNLNKSDINPNGLDADLTHEVKGKQKRVEKDFTDFMKKNEFGEKAIRLFTALEDSTQVYTQNTSRSKIESYKVTLVESTNSRYYDKDSCKRLELVARIEEYDQKIYKYPTKVCVSCKPMFDINMKSDNRCKKCKISTIHGFGDGSTKEVTYNFIRTSSIDPSIQLGRYDVSVKEYDLLSMIQTTDERLNKMKKRILDIPETCPDVRFVDAELQSLQHVNLKRDPDESVEETSTKIIKKTMRSRASSKENTFVEAYFMGDEVTGKDRIEVNRSYKLSAVQTMTPSKQNCVLFCYNIKPLQDSFENFKMNDDIHEMLSMFKPKDDDHIAEHLNDRYKTFGNAAGINGRDDLFFLTDLAYFSTIELNNEQVLPSVTRGWVEVLVAGDPRCGKSIVGEFLFNHYRIGSFIGGSDTIARTGLVGGVVMAFGTKKIQWGIFPKNDKSTVIIDEMSRIDHDGLTSITDLRSSGWAQIEKIESGQVDARVRKIFFSNWRAWHDEDVDTSAYGIELLRKLCYEDPILARFDAAIVIKAGDVQTFDCKYEKITSRFTSLQCRNLIFWAYSRRPDQIKFEHDFAKALNEGQVKLLKKFHSSTQLVNQEMRAKLCRMAISLATMTYSTDPNDWNIIMVKNKHVEYIVNFLEKLYSSKNIGMTEFSEEKRRSEELGDMRFMVNILKYVSLDSILEFKDGNERDISCIFSDYLLKVTRSQLFTVEAMSDKLSNGYPSYQLDPKFIGILRARKCIVRGFNKYRKTEAFTEWLKKRKEQGDSAETSNILELESYQQTAEMRYVPKDFISDYKSKGPGVRN